MVSDVTHERGRRIFKEIRCRERFTNLVGCIQWHWQYVFAGVALSIQGQNRRLFFVGFCVWLVWLFPFRKTPQDHRFRFRGLLYGCKQWVSVKFFQFYAEWAVNFCSFFCLFRRKPAFPYLLVFQRRFLRLYFNRHCLRSHAGSAETDHSVKFLRRPYWIRLCGENASAPYCKYWLSTSCFTAGDNRYSILGGWRPVWEEPPAGNIRVSWRFTKRRESYFEIRSSIQLIII